MACSIQVTSSPRLDAELRHQDGAQVLEDPQRLGLPAGAVQGQHALGPQPLPHGVGAGQRLELAGQRLVVAQCQLGVHPGLGGREPQLFQAARLGPGKRFVTDLAVAGPRQSCSASLERLHALGGTAAGQLAPALGHQSLEPGGVGRPLPGTSRR